MHVFDPKKTLLGPKKALLPWKGPCKCKVLEFELH